MQKRSRTSATFEVLSASASTAAVSTALCSCAASSCCSLTCSCFIFSPSSVLSPVAHCTCDQRCCYVHSKDESNKLLFKNEPDKPAAIG